MIEIIYFFIYTGQQYFDIYIKYHRLFMILTREIEIKISQSNYQYFDDMGYDIFIGEKIQIPVELLSRGSHQKIKCECDGCGLKKDVIFKNYVKYDNLWGYYYCRKCSEKKRITTLKDNFGVEYPLQNKKIFDKRTITIEQKNKRRNEKSKKIKNN